MGAYLDPAAPRLIHGVARALALCAHRVALLHEGCLAGAGAPEEAVTVQALRAIYGVDVEVVPLALPGGGRTRVWLPSLGGRGD